MFRLTLSTLFCLSLVLPAAAAPPSRAALVDPRIGTANEGQTYPAVGVPFAAAHWTPQTRAGEVKCVAPYYAADTRIQGFRGSHFLSGSCVQDYASVTVMALRGELKTDPTERASTIEAGSESAHPHRYDVTLAASGIRASITATARTGLLRFHAPTTNDPLWILVEANARPGEGDVQIDPARREVSGSNPVHRLYAGLGQSAGFSGYFVARFSRPFTRFGTWSGAKRNDMARGIAGGTGLPGGYVGFEGTDEVTVKVGTSFVSVDEARRNLDAEIAGWDFDAVANAAEKAWNDALGHFEIGNATSERARVFYTALYHSMLVPRLYSDVSGTYPEFAGGRTVRTARGFAYYGDFSLWDTFRSLHPLVTLIEPARTRDMLQTLVEMGKQGGWMPIFPAWNSYTQEMIGDHAAAFFADAYIKGIRDFDAETAYKLLRANAMQVPDSYADYVDGRGRRALAEYMKLGYVPLEQPVKEAFHKAEQVSRTLEYAYDDYALAVFADALGKKDDAALFYKRAQNYRNVIDPETKFARGRHADGSWITPFDPAKPAPYITEGLPFQYTFFVPQDVPGLIDTLGGRAAFVAKLDALFDSNSYDHGNEPSHHIAYLYTYAGAPWKTQRHVHEIMAKHYNAGPAGLAGNDDGGQMSAWYVFSAMGFYPVTPASRLYAIGTPEFDAITLVTGAGRRFTVRAPGVESGRFYIQSATLNGKPLERPWLTHDELAAGGELVFVMSTSPNQSWGANAKLPAAH